ncbi:MAG: RecQ family ATP-dependent DNA helicase [Pseudomonadota bacterium]
MTFSDFIARTLLLDLETTRTGRIRHIGAVFGNRIFEKAEKAGSKAVLDELGFLARDADFILGHNLLGHDFPILRASSPDLPLLNKPVIDTLYLSPLAFPQNPYHRLVKNYKLVRSSINNPVEDARLAASVFADQWNSFTALAAGKPALIDFYRFCFHESMFNNFSGTGLATVFSMITPEVIQSPEQAWQCFMNHSTGIVCGNAARETIPRLLSNPEKRPAAAYSLAWLQVAGGNSVLPPWVRHRFPEIPSIIKSLRESPCGSSDCDYCSENHAPEKQLARFFGYLSFREKPLSRQGQSLQKAIVQDCMGDKPVLGILPTGGGKSLCYQLPALVRYWRRGTLTVVISPLQALMKDQVDNLIKKTGTLFAESISGLQTSPERGEVFERIRLGDTAILYISPEQLRSTGVRNILRQREIGCWVFDEAHCLSKWGHDFRPDYLYAARFIREFANEQNQPLPPVCCFTATAKTSVIEEIEAHFREELDQELLLFSGGVERENLSFEVIPVPELQKNEMIHEIISEQLRETDEPSGIIVYAATRDKTEEIRDFLLHQGFVAEAFHGRLDSGVKREVMDAFVTGKIPIICATNAFGMGIDKENIRLVIHHQMPGSLENYIQEAGRAGRDLKPARCILLYSPRDADQQFGLGALSELKQTEIARILRALRRKKRNANGEIVVTSDELLRDEDLTDMKHMKPEFRDNKVRAAVAWLEKAGFLQRNENLTDAFQGKPLVESLEQAEKKIDRLNLSLHAKNLWLNILQFIINSDENRGIRADSLAEALYPEMAALLEMEKTTGRTAAQNIINALHEMAVAGLISQGITLSAIFRLKGRNKAETVFRNICDLENKMITILQEEDPDADDGTWVNLDIRRLNQKLHNEEYNTDPDILRQLIKGISYDGKGFAASLGSFEIRHLDRNHYQVRLQRSWENIRKTIFLRQNVAHVILQELIQKAGEPNTGTDPESAGDIRIHFTSDQLSAAIRSDITLGVEVKKMLPAIERALMFLHEQKVITLQNGLSVLRQAMTIRLAQTARGRYYNKGDFKPLAIHYQEKRFQVHVMMRYAALALEKITTALILVLDYFSLGRIKFINKYFREDKDLLEKAATAETYRLIVENLRNPVQISAVGKPEGDNMLILAGPGSGKTTVIVHRCAYLLNVERIPARQILVLCFNHSSAILLRKRLGKLAGKAAKGVTIATYHGAAMRLSGISIRDMAESRNKNSIDFNQIIREAVMLLRGEKDIPGIEPDEARDRLLAGYSHILVDEYQDIDEDQYNLVSAIAGRSLAEEDGQLTILAVGDDDQNIYTFRGANVRFIRQFQEDYRTKVIYLVENYRSSRHIIAASNALIRNNRDRMKGDHSICINRERALGLPGGRWEQIDPVAEGRVRIITVNSLMHQAVYIRNEIDRIKSLDPAAAWNDFSVLSRTKTPPAAVRSVLEEAGYPLQMTLDKAFPLNRVREIRTTLQWMKEKGKNNCRAGDLQKELQEIQGLKETNIWWLLIHTFLDAYREETDDSLQPATFMIDHFYDFLTEQRREKVVGNGIFLSTIHSAKGMEFPHVFILDGDWRQSTDQAQQEEERRIMYVGMTRAEETLCLLKIQEKTNNPFLKEISGDFMIPQTYRGTIETGNRDVQKYELTDLNEIYLDYAGCFPQPHPIHIHLAELQAGQCVSFRQNNSKLDICDSRGNCVARLSGEGTQKWRDKLNRITEVRVLAMLQRDRNDPEEGFQERIRSDQWELPVLEVVYV